MDVFRYCRPLKALGNLMVRADGETRQASMRSRRRACASACRAAWSARGKLPPKQRSRPSGATYVVQRSARALSCWPHAAPSRVRLAIATLLQSDAP